MSPKSKSIITNTVAGLVFLTAYAIYVTRPGNTPDTLQDWAVSMLVFLGIAIAALIIIQIVFHIILAAGIAVGEGEQDSKRIQRILDSTMAEDEMDRMINLRAARVGYVFAGIGFVGVLVTLAFGLSAVIGLHVLFWSIAIGSFVSSAVSVYGYERGVRRA
jgi:hypothetical protein